MIDVLLVDDHELVRMGIRGLLDERAAVTGIQVVGEASSGEEALLEAKRLKPDVVLMDINMPGIGGLVATRRIVEAQPSVKVLVLTAMDEGPVPRWVLEAGASGYLTKGCRIEEMIAAIQGAMQGERHISPAVAQRLALGGIDRDQANPFDELSGRERQILLMILQGQTPQAIATALNISPKTVSTYKCRVMGKLGISNDLQLVTLAAQHGLIASREVGDN
ncbi:response regulator [Thioalkalivibrio sulfidiphilus]|uniref:response regulator n=1 Tax=Thioalkalivibrio sulfidiphilus TaxID=1033854 RepID=UPI0003701464|nr:response regulator [Thioalkalivibrio sulfidiphilus]